MIIICVAGGEILRCHGAKSFIHRGLKENFQPLFLDLLSRVSMIIYTHYQQWNAVITPSGSDTL